MMKKMKFLPFKPEAL